MSLDHDLPDAPLPTLEEIEHLVTDASAIAARDCTAAEFFRELLDLAVQATSALGGAVWLRSRQGEFTLQHEIALQGCGLVDSDRAKLAHSRLLQSAIDQDELISAPPKSGELAAQETSNPANAWLLVSPQTGPGGEVVVIELFLAPSISVLAQRGAERILATMSGFAGDFLRNRRLRTLEDERSNWSQREAFTRALHRADSTLETAYVIVNDGCRVIDCDRLSLLRVESAGPRLVAATGSDVIDRRSNVVRQLELIAQLATLGGDSIRFTGGENDEQLPPELEEVLQDYVDLQHTRALQVDLLRATDDDRGSDAPVIAVLISERFTNDKPTPDVAEMAMFLEHSTIALKNSIARESGLWRRLLTAAGGWRTRAIWGLALAAVLFVIGWIPVPFSISARGRLQPALRHEIFAPLDGEVVEVLVRQNDLVEANQLLARLNSDELEQELQRLLGSQDTTRQKVNALRSLRGSGAGVDGGPLADQRIAAEILELEAHLESLAKQLLTLRKQQSDLQLRSPADGQVVTWDVKNLLAGRPVRRGQRLLTVVDPDSDWQLELQVPDQRVRHVLQANEELSEQPVRFILASDPGRTYRGRVERIGAAVSIDRNSEAFVPLVASVEGAGLPAPQPGASIVARIHCGRQPLAYVWTHELWETLRTWLFL